MESIALRPTPNQAIPVTLDGFRHLITIKSADGFMTCGIERDGAVLLESGTRIVEGEPLLPYKYMEQGNFIITNQNDEPIDYKKFEASQFLLYVTQDELDAIR